MGFEVGNNCAALVPVFLSFQADNAVGHVELGAESPAILSAESAGEGLLEVVTYCVCLWCGKWGEQ